MMERWLEIMQTHVAGTAHHALSDPTFRSARLLPHGAVLALKREPNNEYDKNAVAISVEDNGLIKRIGYIPATQSPMFAKLMDAGYPIRCTVDFVDEKVKSIDVFVALSIPNPKGMARLFDVLVDFQLEE